MIYSCIGARETRQREFQHTSFQMDGMKPESTADENQDGREESKGL